MSFSFDKSSLLRPQKEKYLSAFLFSALAATLILLPQVLLGGGSLSFLESFYGEQLLIFQRCHNAIRNGEFFGMQALGGSSDYVGISAFSLLGSVFFWLTVPFKSSLVPYLFAPISVLKISFAAVTSYFYIRRFTRSPKSARLGALLYSLSSFSLLNFSVLGCFEAVILLPLLLLCLELLLTENRHIIFALILCLFAVSSPLYLVSAILFLTLYIVVRLGSKAIKLSFSLFVTLIFETLLGICLSAFIVLPLATSFAGLDFSSIPLGWDAFVHTNSKTYADIIIGMFLPSLSASNNVVPIWLPLWSSVGLLTFFANKKNHWIKRILGICLLICLVPILNHFFNLSFLNLYLPFSFMPILLICLATVILSEDSAAHFNFGYKWTFGLTLTLCLLIGLFPKIENGKLSFGLFRKNITATQLLNPTLKYWLVCAIAILGLLLLLPILKTLNKNQKAFYKSSTAFVCIIAVIYGNLIMLGNFSANKQYIAQDISLDKKGEYKVDFYGDSAVLPLGLTTLYPKGNIPASLKEFYEFLGIDKPSAEIPTDYYAVRNLFSVKYVLNPKNDKDFINQKTRETKMPHYKYLDTKADYYVYENQAFIPYGFSYDYMATFDFCKNLSGEQKARLMLKAIVLTDEQRQKYGSMFETLSKKQFSNIDKKEDSFIKDCEQLAKTSATVFSPHSSGFTAKVTRQKPTLVFFSLPYDKGWTATVNGQETKIEKVNGGLMAVKVSNGESVINFSYITPNLLLGLKITTLSAGILLIYIVIYLIWQIKHKPTPCYPEGEQLISRWQEDELREARASLDSHFEEVKRPSILDDSPENEIPTLNEDFKGGFKIDTDL